MGRGRVCANVLETLNAGQYLLYKSTSHCTVRTRPFYTIIISQSSLRVREYDCPSEGPSASFDFTKRTRLAAWREPTK